MTRETLSQEANDLSLDSCSLAPVTNHGVLPAHFFLLPRPGQTICFYPLPQLWPWGDLKRPNLQFPFFSQGLELPQLPAKFPLKFWGAGGRAIILPCLFSFRGGCFLNCKEAEVLTLPDGVRHHNWDALCCLIYTILANLQNDPGK